MNTFERLHPVLQEVLLTGLGWDSLRPVQEESYQAVSSGADILVLAPTAGGKTESAFLPVIDAIVKSPSSALSAVYISPLKALINDQTDRVLNLARRAGLETAVQHGDIAERDRWDFSSDEQPDILLTTPESLEVLLSGRGARQVFSHLRFIIIDEIHAFMETDRGVHLRCLIDRLDFLSDAHCVRIGLSATVGNPEELLMWLSAPDRKKQLVQIPSPPAKKQFSFIVEPDFLRQTDRIIQTVRGKKALIFVESRSFAERLIAPLRSGLSSVYIHHSAVSADDRRAAEESFGGDFGTCVICTSTMELGIDIGELDLVVQYGAPLSVSSFLQRLGRTGRRGKPASMTFVLKNACELMIAVSVIESAARHESEPLSAPAVPYHVLVQQLFLLLRGKTGLGSRQILHSLLSLSPFKDISPETAGEILLSLLQNGYLTKTGDLYQVGPRAEAELGRSNWRGLLSVIQDAGGYTAVLPDGTVVGTLDARFVAGDPGKTFTFTGKTWRLLFRDDAHKRALIEPSSASKGLKRPFWSGDGGGAAATQTVCMNAAKLIARGGTRLPLPPEEREMLDGVLAPLPDDIVPGQIHLRTEPETEGWSVVVSTFFGERANSVLARFIRNRLPAGHTIRYTQFAIRIFEWDSADAGGAVRQVLEEIAAADFSVLADELPALPGGAWKFGNLLPERLQKEMAVKNYYHLPELTRLMQCLRRS